MTIIFHNGTEETYRKDITDEQATKIQTMLDKADKPKKAKKPEIPYVDLGKEDFENDIFDDDGILDLSLIEDCLRDAEYVHWRDNTGEKDNKKPFRLLINDKYLIEFKVTRGYCVESTWDSRIWHADCEIKLISTDEAIPDVEKRPAPVVEEAKPLVVGENEMLFMGDVVEVLNELGTVKLIGGGKFWKDEKVHATAAPWEDFELKNGTHVYCAKELKNVIIFKLNPEDKEYYLSPMKNWYEQVKEN